MTEYMVKKMEALQADLVVCNYLKVFARVNIPNRKMEKNRTYTSEEYIYNTLQDPGHHYFGVVWNKMYKAEIILGEQILFDSKVTLGEDFIFNLQYLTKCKRVSTIGKYLYYYNKEQNASLSQIRKKTIEEKQRWKSMLQKDINIQESLKMVPEAKIRAYDRKYRFESEMKRILKKIGGIN